MTSTQRDSSSTYAAFGFLGNPKSGFDFDSSGNAQIKSTAGAVLVNWSPSAAAVKTRLTTTDGVSSGIAKRVGGVAYSQAGVAVHDSSTETVSASLTVPANTLKSGSIVKVRGRVKATATISTDTLQLKLRFGTTTLTGTALITGTATDVADNDSQYFSFDLMVMADPGATAAIVGNGIYTELAATTLKYANLASTNFATNGALLIEATLKWSTANANSGLVEWMTVEIL